MWPGSPLERRLSTRLSQWEQDGLLRTLRPPAGVDLSSNDYLALAQHPRIVEAFRAGAVHEGVGSTGSRLLRGQRDVFDAVERRVARFKGTDRSLYFSSGYLANIAVLTTLIETGDVLFSDALNHASLIDGARLSRAHRVVFPHNDIGALAAAIDGQPCTGIRFVVVESMFSMDGDFAPLVEIVEVCRRSATVLVVDEAHAFGVLGPTGAGLCDAELLDGLPCVSINTASKALGAAGAFVAGPDAVIEYLVQRARPFVFSTAAPPAVVAAIEASLTLVQDEPERRARVTSNANFLRRRLNEAGINVPDSGSQIIPVHIGDNAAASAVAARLQAQGFDVRAIRPPSVPPGTARLRLSVNAGLSTVTLDRFVGALALVLQEAGLCSAVSS